MIQYDQFLYSFFAFSEWVFVAVVSLGQFTLRYWFSKSIVGIVSILLNFSHCSDLFTTFADLVVGFTTGIEVFTTGIEYMLLYQSRLPVPVPKQVRPSKIAPLGSLELLMSFQISYYASKKDIVWTSKVDDSGF